MRDALAGDPDTAFLAVLHALCLKLFYRYCVDSCLEIEIKSMTFSAQAPGLNDTISAKAIEARHERWDGQLPHEPEKLWDALIAFEPDSRAALFAHCASLCVNAVHEPWNRSPRRIDHADRLAEAVGLDMAVAGWTPTADNYLGRVTKARILEAVREAKGGAAAQMIDHLKKPDMAREAERLLAGTFWLPGTAAHADCRNGDGRSGRRRHRCIAGLPNRGKRRTACPPNPERSRPNKPPPIGGLTIGQTDADLRARRAAGPFSLGDNQSERMAWTG